MRRVKWSRVIIILALLSYAWIIPYEFRVGRFDGYALIPLLVIMIVVLIPMAFEKCFFDIDSMEIPEFRDGNWR